MRKTYRGQITPSSLSSVTIAKLMGCSLSTARKRLKSLPENPTEEDVGMLIYKYRDEKHLITLRRLLS